MITSDSYNGTFVWICSILILAALLIPTVVAVPNTGAATLIGSNNVTIPLTGCMGSDAYVIWGNNPGGQIWITPNETPVLGAVNVKIWGAPLMGNTLYYAKGCDNSGCGNEVSFTTAAITPLPTTTFGAGYSNLSRGHFDIQFVPKVIEDVYSNSSPMGIPRSMLYGILIGLLFLGLWLRTRSIRIPSILGIILGGSGLLFSSSAGLYLGIPGQIQLLAGVLLAASLTGMVVSLILKK